jgi:hypothetical protein
VNVPVVGPPSKTTQLVIVPTPVEVECGAGVGGSRSLAGGSKLSVIDDRQQNADFSLNIC